MVGLLIIVNFKTLSKKIRIPINKMEKFSTELAAGNLQAQISTPEILGCARDSILSANPAP